MLNLTELYPIQEELMNHIDEPMEDEDNLIAFRVELGEFLNEARFFKVWSKDRAPRFEALEEFVDGLHFLLQIGLQKNWTHIRQVPETVVYDGWSKRDLANSLYENTFRNDMDYAYGWCMMLALGEKVGLDVEDIRQAYLDKNKVNHQRQEEGY